MDEQVILSKKETCEIYDRLQDLEKKVDTAENLYHSLKNIERPKPSYKFNFFGDAGLATNNQLILADRMFRDKPHAIFMAGDNTYTDPGDLDSVTKDQMAFDHFRSECRTYPALGNHDLDVEPLGQFSSQLYQYLPGNKRYYTKYFNLTGVQIFVLNSGRQSNATLVEPDGNSVGSIQHQWFVNEVLKSTAKWKVVIFHHPIFSQVSQANSGTSYLPELDWGFEDYGIDLVINGHNHLNAHHKMRGLNYVQMSGTGVRSFRNTRTSTNDPYGSAEAELIYKDNRGGSHKGLASYGRLIASETGLKVEFVDIATCQPYYCFGVTNCNSFNVDCIQPRSYCDPCKV